MTMHAMYLSTPRNRPAKDSLEMSQDRGSNCTCTTAGGGVLSVHMPSTQPVWDRYVLSKVHKWTLTSQYTCPCVYGSPCRVYEVA